MFDWLYDIDREKIKKNLLRFGAIIFALGIYFWFFDVQTYDELQELIDNDEVITVEATVTYYKKEVTRSLSGTKHYSCRVEYEYDFSNRTYTGLDNSCTLGREGDTIDVYIEKEDPYNNYTMQDGYGYKQYLGYLTIIGAVMVIAGFFVREY